MRPIAYIRESDIVCADCAKLEGIDPDWHPVFSTDEPGDWGETCDACGRFIRPGTAAAEAADYCSLTVNGSFATLTVRDPSAVRRIAEEYGGRVRWLLSEVSAVLDPAGDYWRVHEGPAARPDGIEEYVMRAADA